MEDTRDSKSPPRKGMRVRLPPPAPRHQPSRIPRGNPGSAFPLPDAGMCRSEDMARGPAARGMHPETPVSLAQGDSRVLQLDPIVDLKDALARSVSEPNIARLFER